MSALNGAPNKSAGNENTCATLTKQMLLRTQKALSRMNSLSSATGHAILDQYNKSGDFESPEVNSSYTAGPQQMMILGHQYQRPMVMSSLASNASLSRAAAARALGFSGTNGSPLNSSYNASSNGRQQKTFDSPLTLDHSQCLSQINQKEAEENAAKTIEQLQMILLKIIVKRDPSIYKYFILFTIFGFLLFVHCTYFFLYVEKLCTEQGYVFSTLMGALIAAQAISEVFSFIVIVPYYVPRVGRIGAMVTCSLVFFVRYFYYGTYFHLMSPYTALFTETCHGIAYGIAYTLITDVAIDCVNQVDAYLPELIERKLVDPSINPNILKLPLRATMQGVFSGAFDGLGNGIGCLFAGIYLDSYSFVGLCLVCAIVSASLAIIYPLTEYKVLFGDGDQDKKKRLSNSVLM